MGTMPHGWLNLLLGPVTSSHRSCLQWPTIWIFLWSSSTAGHVPQHGSYPALNLSSFLSHTGPEAKVPPTPTSSKGGDIQSSGVGQAIAHSVPGVRQPTKTGLSAIWASMSQTQITPALGQGSRYGRMPISRGSLPVPVEAISFGVPPSQPHTSMQPSQEVPVSRPIHPMT